jgi:DNA-directed RNA polymerase subunit RPC12/RpoP
MPTGQYPDDFILVVCSTCHARLHPRWDQAGKKIVCPDCGKTLRIPWPKKVKESAGPRPEDIGDYGVHAAEKPFYAPSQFYEAQIIYARPVPPPPRWTFFSGVFQFPWYRNNVTRWMILSFGLAVIGEMLVGALALFGIGVGGGIGSFAVVAMGFLILPISWSSIWTLSYAAGCLLAVVEETAAGNDEINWPDDGWRERVWKLLYAGYLLVLSALAGTAVGSLAQLLAVEFWWSALATTFVLFPIVLLSSLEAGTPWAPLTPPIIRSLVVSMWCWGVFYIEITLLATPWVALVLVGVQLRHPFWTALVAAPPLAALLLIYARLLGRLAWRITDI